MLKNRKTILLLIIVALTSVSIIAYLLLAKKNYNEPLIYINNESMFHDFVVTDNLVTFNCSIVVKNNSNKNLDFYMYADISKELGLVTETIAPACEEYTLQKQKYSIKAKSQQTFGTYFKAKGSKNKKQDRLPPENIIFEIIK